MDWLDNFWSILFSILSIIVFIICFQLLCNRILYFNLRLASVIFFTTMFFLKILLVFYQYPSYLYHLQLFSPIIYASSNLIPSLGDFLIVALMALWYAIMINNKNKLTANESNIYLKNIKLFFINLIIVLSVDSGIDSIKSLVFDSQISLSLKNIYLLNQFSFYGLILFVIIHICIKNCITFIKRNTFNKWALANVFLLVYLIIHPLIINLFFGRSHIFYLGSASLIITFVSFNTFATKANRF